GRSGTSPSSHPISRAPVVLYREFSFCPRVSLFLGRHEPKRFRRSARRRGGLLSLSSFYLDEVLACGLLAAAPGAREGGPAPPVAAAKNLPVDRDANGPSTLGV